MSSNYTTAEAPTGADCKGTEKEWHKATGMWTTCFVRFEKLSGMHEVQVRASEETIKEARRFGTLDRIPGLEGATVVILASEKGDNAWARRSA